MVARRENRTQVNPRPIGPWVAPEPSRRFTEPILPSHSGPIRAGHTCPPAYGTYEAALNAARVLAYQWSAWASVVAAHAAREFLVLTGAHEEFLALRLVLVQVGPEGQERYPWATE